MSVQSALQFIRKIRQLKTLTSENSHLMNIVTISELQTHAEEEGCTFSAEELRTAHALDWQMRWHRLNSWQSAPEIS